MGLTGELFLYFNLPQYNEWRQSNTIKQIRSIEALKLGLDRCSRDFVIECSAIFSERQRWGQSRRHSTTRRRHSTNAIARFNCSLARRSRRKDGPTTTQSLTRKSTDDRKVSHEGDRFIRALAEYIWRSSAEVLYRFLWNSKTPKNEFIKLK